MDEKNRNKLDILYIQFLNFSIFPHLYSIYTPSSANSANFTNIGFHKARVFRSNIPLTFDSSDTKKYPSSRIMAFEAELSFLACPDPRKRKGRGKNIYPHIYIYIYIQRTKGNNSTARRSSSSFKIVPATVLNLKELKDLRQCDKCSCSAAFCRPANGGLKGTLFRLWEVRLSSCTNPLCQFIKERVCFCVHLRYTRDKRYAA